MKTIRLYHKGVSLFLAVLFTLYATGCKVYAWRQIAITISAFALTNLNPFIVESHVPG